MHNIWFQSQTQTKQNMKPSIKIRKKKRREKKRETDKIPIPIPYCFCTFFCVHGLRMLMFPLQRTTKYINELGLNRRRNEGITTDEKGESQQERTNNVQYCYLKFKSIPYGAYVSMTCRRLWWQWHTIEPNLSFHSFFSSLLLFSSPKIQFAWFQKIYFCFVRSFSIWPFSIMH